MAEAKEPPTYAELVAENAALRGDVGRLQTSVGSLQSTVIARETEIAQLRNPRAPARVLSADATDKFSRPARLR